MGASKLKKNQFTYFSIFLMSIQLFFNQYGAGLSLYKKNICLFQPVKDILVLACSEDQPRPVSRCV